MRVEVIIDGNVRLVRSVATTLDVGAILFALGHDMLDLPVVLLGSSVLHAETDTIVLRLVP